MSLRSDTPPERNDQLPLPMIVEIMRVARRAAQEGNLEADEVGKIIRREIENKKDLEEIKQLFDDRLKADPWSSIAPVYQELIKMLNAPPAP